MTPQSNLYLCRLCLQKTPTKVSIYHGEFPKMVEVLTSVRFREGDGLPMFSCAKCVLDVKQAMTIRKRILATHKTLLECLQKERRAASLHKPTVAQSNLQSRKTNPPVVKRENIETVETIRIINVMEMKQPDASELSSNDSNTTVENVKLEDKNSSHEEVQSVLTRDNMVFHCEICDIIMDSHLAAKHCRKHKKSKCTICDKLITSSNLKKHILTHSVNPIDCKLCGTIYKNSESLRGHTFHQHKCTPGTFVCEECDKKFRTRGELHLHQKKVHIGLRNFKCETCGKRFFANANLNKHINMTHKKLRPYICEFCGASYSSECMLNAHKRKHTNEKPFVCQHCSAGFRHKVSLRYHLKSKHGYEEAQEVFCGRCGKGFATNYALNIHMRLHMFQKCKHCSESFVGSEYLKKHLRDVHNKSLTKRRGAPRNKKF